jgi:predicted Zn-ribbon and HTH transcriptional regulator
MVGFAIMPVMAFRRDVIALLEAGPRTASSLGRELGVPRDAIEQELQHAIRSAKAAGRRLMIEPARCRTCGFVFDERKLTKPGRCPSCRGSRIYEPLLRIE